MDSVFPVYKPRGVTPLECVKQFKKKYPNYENSTVSYAGRLDPMAEGLLILLCGTANKRRGDFQTGSKTYDFTALFGISTDTYDLLGKITSIKSDLSSPITLSSEFISSFTQKLMQPYPPYSSKPVQGKPLFYWARENKLSEITIPKKEVEIYTLLQKQAGYYSLKEIQKDIKNIFPKLSNDFRQVEVFTLWEEYTKNYPLAVFPTLSFSVTCSSGTYIRSLVNSMGEKLGCGAIAIRICKTKQGTFSIGDAVPLFDQ